MRVLVLAGARAGQETEFPDYVAEYMLKEGDAKRIGKRVPVEDDDDEAETAIADPAPQRAVTRSGRPRGSKNRPKGVTANGSDK